MLILENVDDAGFLLDAREVGQSGRGGGLDGGESRPLVSYLPQRDDGSVLKKRGAQMRR